MAFFGNKFVFNGIPCEDFDLMMYEVDSNTHSQGTFASTVSIKEETVGTRYKPYFYGVSYESKLEMKIVFGVNENRIDAGKWLDRYELESIASWLTGYDKYMWLEIEQEDMQYVRYKCMITGLDIIEYGEIPWALQATVTCDGPFAYMYPQVFSYQVNGSMTIEIYNESSINGFYYPLVDIMTSSGSISIKNETDNNRTFSLSGVPSGAGKITIDNDRCVIASSNGINMYQYCNYTFFRLVKGYNRIVITGTGTVNITCEFPINTGG